MMVYRLRAQLRWLERDLAEAKQSGNRAWLLQISREMWLARQSLFRLEGVLTRASAQVGGRKIR
jgi:hypothetical protein